MKKKITTIIIILLICAGLGGGIYYYLNKQDDNTLTILEKQWIEDNKNNMIDLSIPNNIPIFGYEGNGLIYDLLETLEKDVGLEFNKIPYIQNDNLSNYAFTMVDSPDKQDIVIYEDNYALITREGKKYTNISDIKDITVGVVKSELEQITYYLNSNAISLKTYDSRDELIKAFLEENNKLDGIIIPKTICMDTILENDLTISYNITEMKQFLVLKLGNEKRLNSILKKYYQKWQDNNYEKTYANHFSEDFYSFKNIDDDTKVNFKSKRYKYGFISNAPYDELIEQKLVGVNSEIIKNFVSLTGIEVSYDHYNSNADLMKDFNSNKLDFFFNTSSKTKFDMDTISTVSIVEKEVVVLENINNTMIINSLASIKNSSVLTINNTQINDFVESKEIATKKYKTIKDLLKNVNKSSILVLDKQTYDIYKTKELKDFKIATSFELDNSYSYVLRDIKDNKLFNEYFSFYLQFINEKSILNKVNYQTFEQAEKLVFLRPLMYSLFAIIILVVATILFKKLKTTKKDNIGISKENKIKYIDMLTSLKNRNYLNDNIEKWDDSEIYPQAIIIVDLNNIAYINDNYGHNEGDNVIKEAANILIKNQLANTEIIRTNGNEFLIYLVEYDEKQIVSYVRKLNKEFKELEHGFGAAVGYSMIQDGLKTLDDAINEATLDMRANKEEAHD